MAVTDFGMFTAPHRYVIRRGSFAPESGRPDCRVALHRISEGIGLLDRSPVGMRTLV